MKTFGTKMIICMENYIFNDSKHEMCEKMAKLNFRMLYHYIVINRVKTTL